MGGQVGRIRISRSALLLIGAMMVLAIGVSSCAKPPTAELELAKSAIASATAKEAQEYAPGELKAAQDSLAKGEAEIQTQQGKFALFRSYKKATALVLSAQQKGQEAEQAAIRNKEQFRKDSEAAIAQAEQAIADARTFMGGKEVQALKRGKETREALKQIEAELNAADSTLAGQVKPMHQQEKFKMSLNAAKGVQSQVSGLMQELQQAVTEKKFISRMPKQM
jgi:hypothetical protein